MNKESLLSVVAIPKEQSRHYRAKFVRERIYGGVTMLALNMGMLIKGDFTVGFAYDMIISTIIGLWLASMFAAVMSYRIVHDKNMPRAKFMHELSIHRGLLLAAVPSLIMISLAAFDLIAIRTALIADICVAITAMTVYILRSGKTKSNSFATAGISVGFQLAIAGLIIFIKLGAG